MMAMPPYPLPEDLWIHITLFATLDALDALTQVDVDQHSPLNRSLM
jgi:hypothetical protein